jgi:hypothetical protein
MAGTSGTAGSSGSAGAAGAAKLALCANPAAVGRVVVRRTAVIYHTQPGHVQPPAQTTVTAAAKARALAKALCALPRTPKGIIACPAVLDGLYKLSFTVDGRLLPLVTIRPTSCGTVTGLGPARSAAASPRLWTTLAQAGRTAASVPPAGLPALRGTSGCSLTAPITLGNTHCPGHAVPGDSSHI